MNPLAVIIVTHRSAPVIGACLDSLIGAEGPAMRIVVVDNASPDDTVTEVRRRQRAELISAPGNLGYGAGVNIGLRHILPDPAIRWVWILNPDCRVPADTPVRYADACREAGQFGLLGGRTLYSGGRAIQSDGGRIDRCTGTCRLVNRGAPPDAPAPAAETLDFLTGANLIASRAFIDRAGPMPEDYFLFYEEVDWAMRRGDLPIRFHADICVEHEAGTATGSAAPGRNAGAFANYFNYRARMRFLRRHFPAALPTAVPYALMQAGRLAAQARWPEAEGALRGTLGLSAPRTVRDRLEGARP